MSHMSSNDEISPVKPRIDYSVFVDHLLMPLQVTCDDVVEEGRYMRFMDGDVPAVIVPIDRLAAVRRIVKEPAK